jgi:hypothetical protein
VSKETEPQEVMRKAAMDALRASGMDLRQRGWPVEMIVDYVAERDAYVVSLRVALPSMPRPIEAA